ncbi:TetR/AcrR family transcriptional regulator [Calidifontibacter sp. DB0510]|uniref:TetR/AcrR family transcriptional regulator n=1 Tax=Metallococcus carri TaxID=1656884 RepID=A0A967B1L6_9MICO|nr:TetR/AcrR family transcriptional regulator [Metallococcus carri]NHN55828.1 TetR/AcrR family transcriptional regulator [Metallococcus carri]NOP38484.1 TetR/AcrR family transcriptional regulator [Calidifontibacter sp. DB2511S]
MTPARPTQQSLRSDAERNRDRLLDAARGAFRELGAQAPMVEIARRAGVASATLYRRFPTRESLVAEVFAGRLTSCEDSVRAALQNPDAWKGLTDHIHYLTTLQAEDRAFTAVFLYAFPEDSPVAESRRDAGDALRALLTAAKTAGQLRADVAEGDLMSLLMANDGILRWSPDPSHDSARLIDQLLRAWRS